jgi:hypothetical protein
MLLVLFFFWFFFLVFFFWFSFSIYSSTFDCVSDLFVYFKIKIYS